MEKNNKTTGEAHGKQHDSAPHNHDKSKTTTSSGCKKGSCSTSEKKGKATHTQDEDTGTC